MCKQPFEQLDIWLVTLSCLWPFLNLPFQLSGELWSVHSECEETLVLNAEMQTIFPLTRAGMPTVQCVQCRVQLYTTCWSCQLRMVPDPVKTWTTPLPTHSKCCLRHRPGTSGSAGVNLWWKCEEIIALWSLPVKILRRNHTVVLYNLVIISFLPLVTINFEVSKRQWRVRVNEKTMNHNETLFTCRLWHDISYHSFEEEVINIKTKWAAAAQSLKDFERIQYLGMNCGRILTSLQPSPACFIIRNRRSISSGKGQRWVNMHILQPAYRLNGNSNSLQ